MAFDGCSHPRSVRILYYEYPVHYLPRNKYLLDTFIRQIANAMRVVACFNSSARSAAHKKPEVHDSEDNRS